MRYTCFCFIALFIICISSEEVQKIETLHAIRIPKKVIQDFIKYNTDVLFSFLSYYSPKYFKTLKFGSNKFKHPVLKLVLQNSEADHADVDIEFKEYPQNTVQVTFKNLILNIADKGSKGLVQIKVVWLSFKFDVMKSILKPFENFVNDVTWKIDATSLKFVGKRNERTSELSINQRNEIAHLLEDKFTTMKTGFLEFCDIISDKIQSIQKSYVLVNKLLENWNEIKVSSDNILICLIFEKDIAIDNYSLLSQQIEKNNSTSIQYFMSDYINVDLVEMLYSQTKNLTERIEISFREYIPFDVMLYLNDYFNTDFIGQYFVTTPSLSEEFGKNRKVDFVIGKQSVELMKKLGLYHAEPLFSKNGDLILSAPISFILRVKDSSNAWIDFRSVYLEYKMEINFEKIIKTKDSSFMIKAKTGKFSLKNFKIFKGETEMIDEEIQLKTLLNLGLSFINPIFSEAINDTIGKLILPYFKMDCIYEIANINQTFSTKPTDSVTFDIDLYFHPLSKRCTKYCDNLFSKGYSQFEWKPKIPLSNEDVLRTIVKEDL